MAIDSPPKGKNPRRALAGKAGMAARWGPPPARIVRLDELDPVTADVIRAIWRAAKSGAITASQTD